MAKDKVLFWDEILTFLLPILMFTFGINQTLTSILTQWTTILVLGSFMFGIMALNVGHHGPQIIHEGDKIKSFDFGIYQIETQIERKEVNENLAISISTFGNHLLHHFFPSLDHALLPQLRPILEETCNEFGIQLREFSTLDSMKAQFQQLGRTEVI